MSNSDLISREAAIEAILGSFNAIKAIEELHAVDAVPVVHARWKRSNDFNGYCHCSACHNVYIDPDWIKGGKWQYCPCCGAIMDGGEGDG